MSFLRQPFSSRVVRRLRGRDSDFDNTVTVTTPQTTAEPFRVVLSILTLTLLVSGCQPVHQPVAQSAVVTHAPDPFLLYRQHDYAAAEAAFRQLGRPATVDTLLARADCERHLHQADQEFDTLKQAVRSFPKSAAAWVALSRLETRAGRLDHADLALRRAIAADPTNTDAWCERGLLRLRQHRNDEAIGCFNRALGGPAQTDVASASN